MAEVELVPSPVVGSITQSNLRETKNNNSWITIGLLRESLFITIIIITIISSIVASWCKRLIISHRLCIITFCKSSFTNLVTFCCTVPLVAISNFLHFNCPWNFWRKTKRNQAYSPQLPQVLLPPQSCWGSKTWGTSIALNGGEERCCWDGGAMTQVMQLMSQEQHLQSEQHLLVLLWEQSLHQIVESFRALAIPFLCSLVLDTTRSGNWVVEIFQNFLLIVDIVMNLMYLITSLKDMISMKT